VAVASSVVSVDAKVVSAVLNGTDEEDFAIFDVV